MKVRGVQKGLAALLALVIGHVALAQGIVSAIRGVAADPSGVVVHNAAVAILDISKGWTRSTLTNQSGGYEFVQLAPAGIYSITVRQ